MDAADALELLAKAPDPASAARLTIAAIRLRRARHRNIADKAIRTQAMLRAEHLSQPDAVTVAYTATTRAAVAVINTLDEQVKALPGPVDAYFGRRPGACRTIRALAVAADR
ncbi:MAG: hypothetical protein LC790_23225 [Actinobacteria bacterium]|nr:hypothetical protein [Actinomycetota bacterium]